jgi:hypothetical protein
MNSRLQSCSGPHPRRRLNLSYQSQSFWTVLTHSSFSGFFCVFFFMICFILFLFPFLSFPCLFPAAYLCTSPGKEKSPECQPMAQMAAKYKKSKLGCANSQEITMESMPVLPFEESCPNTLTTTVATKSVIAFDELGLRLRLLDPLVRNSALFLSECICSTIFQRKNWHTFHGNFLGIRAGAGGPVCFL